MARSRQLPAARRHRGGGALQHEAPFRVGLFGSGYRIVLPAIRELFLGGELGLAGGRHGRVLNPFAGLNLGFDL